MKRALVIACCAVLAAASAAAQSQGAAPASEKSKLEALMDANRELTDKFNQTKKTEGEIAKAELEISGSHRALDKAIRDFERFGVGLQQEAASIDQQAAQSGCPWGGKAEKTFAQSCNAMADRLHGMLEDIRRRGEGAQEYGKKLLEERERLNKATLDAAEKRRQNNKIQREIEAGFQQWQNMYNRFVFQSEAYEQLKRIAPASTICDLNSVSGSYSSLRRAVPCLERLFDAAR